MTFTQVKNFLEWQSFMFVQQVQYLVRKYIKAGNSLYELEPPVVRVSLEATLLNI